jgi:ADP-heptose:LPS heptosyltransferase
MVVAFFCNGLGDSLMTLPTVRALTARFQERLLLVCSETFRQFATRDLPGLNCRTMHFWRDENHGKCFDPDELFAIEQEVHASTFVSLVPWISPSLARYLTRTKCLTFGHFGGFHVRIPYAEGEHAALNAFKLAKVFSPEGDYMNYAGPLRLRPRESEFGARLLAALPAAAFPVLVHLETGAAKQLPPPWINQVLACLVRRHPNVVIINIGRQPPPIDIGECHGTVLHLGNDSIFEGLAVAARSRLFFGVDSCFLHAADMYGVPGVGVFRSTDPAEFGYLDTPSGVNYGTDTFSARSAAEVVNLLGDRMLPRLPLHQEST